MISIKIFNWWYLKHLTAWYYRNSAFPITIRLQRKQTRHNCCAHTEIGALLSSFIVRALSIHDILFKLTSAHKFSRIKI